MIIVMDKSATQQQIDNVIEKIKDKGLDASVSKGIEKTVIGAIGDERILDPELLESLPGVQQALHIVKPYKIVAREWHSDDTIINIKGNLIGGDNIQVISGVPS
jgi:3-deoxy-7-phosphoheptulonate synthase